MNTKKFTYLLENPQKISKEDLTGLASVIKKYPYFQSAHALQLKGLKNESSFLYNDALKLTAAYTTDRDILFEYITSDSFIQNEIVQFIQEKDDSIQTMEVDSEDISEHMSVELDNKIKTELKKAEAILDPDLFERKLESVKDIISQPELEAEKTLELDKPLKFTKSDTHSFSEWLKLTSATPIDRSSEDPIEKKELSKKERKNQLIDKFIQEKPKLKPTKTASDTKDLSEPFIQTSETLMTETLAKVYVQQKNYTKAIHAYKILILKYPEKSGFFADQIGAIKKLINTKEQ